MNLALFLTAGVSLADWQRQGILERELALYRALVRRGHSVTLVTYGGEDDRRLGAELGPGLAVAVNRLGLRRHHYARAIPLLHALVLRRADVIKCNQADGGEVALRAAQWHRKPFVARSGYPWARTLAERLAPGTWEIGYARQVEASLAAGCRRWIVTTEAARRDLEAEHPAVRGKIRVVPNSVDVSRFLPGDGPRDIDVLWVGRLEDEKRPGLLLEAAARLPGLRVAFIGAGSQEGALREQAVRLGVSAQWVGTVPHAGIAGWMRRSTVYAITSRYEGHPKSLLEAMACAMPCVGVEERGIRDELENGVTGRLCAPTAEALSDALRGLLEDAPGRAALGQAARRRVLARYTPDAAVELECAVLEEALREGPVR